MRVPTHRSYPMTHLRNSEADRYAACGSESLQTLRAALSRYPMDLVGCKRCRAILAKRLLAAEGKVEVRISDKVWNEYIDRLVFRSFYTGPDSRAYCPTVTVTRKVAREMLDDALFQIDPYGPDEMPAPVRAAYRALAAQLKKLLAV